MSERNRDPDAYEPLERLQDPESESGESEDVIALVGFVGPRSADGPLRLFADEDGQRYLQFDYEDFVDAEDIDGDDRKRVYIRRDVMVANAFTEDVLTALGAELVGPPMTLWQFLPQNRLVAAEMLGMLPERRYEEEAAP